VVAEGVGHRKRSREMKIRIARRVREHRARIEFNRVFDAAEPSMRQELLAAATRQNLAR
jgi:hypothetical protein